MATKRDGGDRASSRWIFIPALPKTENSLEGHAVHDDTREAFKITLGDERGGEVLIGWDPFEAVASSSVGGDIVRCAAASESLGSTAEPLLPRRKHWVEVDGFKFIVEWAAD